jgi:hypothetical protein
VRKIALLRWIPSVLLAVLILPPSFAATAGNGFYQVTVNEGGGGVGVGVYTATTDVLHPVTAAYGAQNVLFGGGIPSTSWTTIHSYTSGTAYTQRPNQALVAGAPIPLILESFAVAGEEAVPVGTTGFQTHYMVTGAGGGNDDLDIFQTIRAVGTNFNDSAVEVTTELFNLGTQPVDVGIRYLLDFQIGGGDDGPAFRLRNPDGPVAVVEHDIPVPANETFDILDNNDPADFTCSLGPTNMPFPLFSVGGSVRGPTSLQPTAPTLLQLVSWQHLSGLPGKTAFFPAQDAFFYAIGPHDAASCVISVDDSGATYFWGEAPGSAFTVQPGQSAKVSVYLFAFLPGQPPTFPLTVEDCDDGIDNDGDGLVDDDDPDCDDLLVDLVSFDAASGRRGVILSWTTATEVDNAGFLILRSTSPSGPFVPITPVLIPAEGSGISGATYEFEDRTARRKRVYYYQLIDVDLTGVMTMNGPVAGSWGEPKPPKHRR